MKLVSMPKLSPSTHTFQECNNILTPARTSRLPHLESLWAPSHRLPTQTQFKWRLRWRNNLSLSLSRPTHMLSPSIRVASLTTLTAALTWTTLSSPLAMVPIPPLVSSTGSLRTLGTLPGVIWATFRLLLPMVMVFAVFRWTHSTLPQTDNELFDILDLMSLILLHILFTILVSIV